MSGRSGGRYEGRGGEGRGRTDFGCESGGFLEGAEELGGLCAFGVFDFSVVEETDRRTAPYQPVSVMLSSRHASADEV